MPGIFIGGVEIKDVYLGGNKLKEVYVGSTKVWPSGSASNFISYFGVRALTAAAANASAPTWASNPAITIGVVITGVSRIGWGVAVAGQMLGGASFGSPWGKRAWNGGTSSGDFTASVYLSDAKTNSYAYFARAFVEPLNGDTIRESFIRVSGQGVIRSFTDEGWEIVKGATGVYSLTAPADLVDTRAIMITPFGTGFTSYNINASSTDSRQFTVEIRNFANTAVDTAFALCAVLV